MRKLILLACSLFLPCALPAQTVPTHAQTQTDLTQALLGNWTGVLEYRDFSEPATSTKRVQLPTWLSITAEAKALKQHFIYDDGPAKTVDSTDLLVLDVAASSYSEITPEKPARVYVVSNYDKLKSGYGDLILTGAGTDNDKPAQIRITLSIRRNLLTWTEETRPAGSAEAFVFRHSYRFTRAQPPIVTAH